MRKALKNNGWTVERVDGSHVTMKRDGKYTANFEGNNNKDASMKAIKAVKEAVENMRGRPFNGNQDFANWVDQNK